MDVVQLLPQLHFLHLPVANAYLWDDPEGLTLIDSGLPGSGPAIAEAIRGLGHDTASVRRLILTHFHVDHVGSAAEVASWGDVTVIAHRDDAPVIRGDATGAPPVMSDWEQALYDQISGQVPDAPPERVRVDVELHDGDIVDFGGGAQALAVPGHTPGSVAMYLAGPKVLFTGDTVARGEDGQVMLGVFNVDPRQAVASFKRQAKLDVEIACFGHGEPVTEGAGHRLRAAAERLPDA